MIVIDARKAMDAGIGTYIRELVPRVCSELGDIKCELLVSSTSRDWAEQLTEQSRSNITYTLLNAPPFSFKEQILLRNTLKKRTLFWATSLSHPLFYSGNYITTVHDVAQLALSKEMAGGLITKIASKVYFQSILRNSRELIFISEFSRSEFTRHVGKPTQPTSVIHLGVDSAWFASPKTLPTPYLTPYFITVSSIRPHKNFAFLLKVFLSASNLIPHNLVIVGDKRGLSDFDSSLMKRISNLGTRVQFLGRIKDEDLKRRVTNADAMIFPSLYEGFGLPPIEAMAAGCPVISSSSAAMKEVCGDAAIYFDPLNPISLLNALIMFASCDKSMRESLNKAGREKALNYDWSKTAKATATIIRRSTSDYK